MRNKKLGSALPMLCGLAFALAACFNFASAGQPYKFVFLSPNQGNPFWMTVSRGVEDTCKKMGASVTVYDAQDDPAKQVSQAEDAILSGIDALLVSPFETDTGTAITELANRANLPVFILDNGSNGDYTAFIAADNEQGGEIAAQFVLDNTGADRNIVEMQGLIGAPFPPGAAPASTR